MSQLATLFAQYGVEPFLESTSLLVALLDKDGTLLSWNPAFGMHKEIHPDKVYLKDFLSSGSGVLFDRILTTTLDKRTRTKSNLEFLGDGPGNSFICLFVPLPERRVLLIRSCWRLHSQR